MLQRVSDLKWILWKDLGNGKWSRDVELELSKVSIMPGSLETLVSELPIISEI
jgi:hypothetical protein